MSARKEPQNGQSKEPQNGKDKKEPQNGQEEEETDTLKVIGLPSIDGNYPFSVTTASGAITITPFGEKCFK